MTTVRGRVLLGASLWTLGLLATWSVILTYHHPAFESLRIVHQHAPFMTVLAVVSMIAGAAVVHNALAPLRDIRRHLAAVRDGTADQVRGSYPAEVQPVIDDLNALLAHVEEVVARASTKAGDLAHGLKTPLAVLANEADRLERQGDAELSAMIGAQIAMMRRHVEYHLAHARAAASGKAVHAHCNVADSVSGLVRTLGRLHAERGIRIDADIDSSHAFTGRCEDFDEMLGNLLDNACKWARTRVVVSSSVSRNRVVVVVDDDGAGLDPEVRQLVLQRGVRRDEGVPGSGLGLAIVRDLADLYDGSIVLDRSDLGGVAARLDLPGGIRGRGADSGV